MARISHFSVALIALLVFPLTAAFAGKAGAESEIKYVSVAAPSLKAVEAVNAGVYLPAGYDSGMKHYPVLYYLSGFGQDERSWEAMGIKKTLDDLIATKAVPPMIVVTPGSRDTGWTDWIDGRYDWEEFVAYDLVAFVDEKYRTLSASSMRAISGNSAGGQGALVIGFLHPEIFGTVSSHSAAVHPEDPDKLPAWAKGWDGWKLRVGDPIDVRFWRSQNPLYLARTLDKEHLIAQWIYFDVGNKDHLGFAATNVELSEVLKSRGIPHSFFLREGGHGSKFVYENARYALEFHGRFFSRKRKEQSF